MPSWWCLGSYFFSFGFVVLFEDERKEKRGEEASCSRDGTAQCVDYCTVLCWSSRQELCVRRSINVPFRSLFAGMSAWRIQKADIQAEGVDSRMSNDALSHVSDRIPTRRTIKF